MRTLDDYKGWQGIWVIYDYNGNAQVLYMHVDLERVVEEVGKMGYGKIAFWQVGTEFAEAIKKWENSNRSGEEAQVDGR